MDYEKKFKVGCTKEYGMFDWLDDNRELNERKITRLAASIEKNGLQVPVIVNTKKEIVDGQHRFKALERLNYHIHYIVSEHWTQTEHTAEINNTQDKWSALDWANWAAENGCLDAGEALEIAGGWESKTQRKLRKITGMELLMDGRTHSGMLTKLKKRLYKIDSEVGSQIMDTLNEMNKYDMQCKPYSQKIARAIKVLNFDKKDLEEEAIAIMCGSRYIPNYSNESDMYEFLKDEYEKAVLELKKRRKKTISNNLTAK